MQRLANARAHSVGLRSDERIELPSVNHYKAASSLSKTAAAQIKTQGLVRVAGNYLICRSTRDFWKLDNGKLIRITKTEVDNGESIPGAPASNPSAFIDELLNDLTF